MVNFCLYFFVSLEFPIFGVCKFVFHKSFYISTFFLDPPKILNTFSENVQLARGRRTSIKCLAAGSSNLNIYWKDGETIMLSNELRMNPGSKKGKKFDAKNFICVAENAYGMDFQDVPIKVVGEIVVVAIRFSMDSC